jgi:hypothetical protein
MSKSWSAVLRHELAVLGRQTERPAMTERSWCFDTNFV